METKRSELKLSLIVDLDHTLGDFSRMYQAIHYFVHCLSETPMASKHSLQDKLNCLQTLIQFLFGKHPDCLRPNLTLIIQTFKKLKKSGKIKSIHILTAGSLPNPFTFVGEFFMKIGKTPQELILDYINNLDLTYSDKKFFDEIKFTNGALKSTEDFNLPGYQFIIIDDLPYQSNYSWKGRKRKREDFLPGNVMAHLEISPFVQHTSEFNSETLIFTMKSFYKNFTGFPLDFKFVEIYTTFLKENFKGIDRHNKKMEQNEISSVSITWGKNSKRRKLLCKKLQNLFLIKEK